MQIAVKGRRAPRRSSCRRDDDIRNPIDDIPEIAMDMSAEDIIDPIFLHQRHKSLTITFRKTIVLACSGIEGGDVHKDEYMGECSLDIPQGAFQPAELILRYNRLRIVK